ncbi:MAG: hypothetical protein ACLSAH_13485 [Bilophila wadsworthia]
MCQGCEVLNWHHLHGILPELKQLWDPSSPTWKRPPASRSGVLRFGLRRSLRMRSKGRFCWIGNKGAIQMVDRSDGSVFAQTTAADGTDGYYPLW